MIIAKKINKNFFSNGDNPGISSTNKGGKKI